MLKEAIEKILEISKPTVYREQDSWVVVTSAGEAKEYSTEKYVPDTLEVYSLDALVKMVRDEAIDKYEPPFFISVPNHLTVECKGKAHGYEERYIRPRYYCARATDVPQWDATTKMKFEEMQIAIRTRFQETPDSVYVLKLLSDITTGGKVTFSDNGIATSVVTQKGIALQSNEMIRPIVKLKPYRTFQEIEQPESQFLIRVSEGGILLTEADGGMWKLKARQTIKEYLENVFKQEIECGLVVVMI